LIEGDLVISSTGNLQVHDFSFLGQTNVLATHAGAITLDFSDPVDAFGFDYFPFVLTQTDVTLMVFAGDDTTLLATQVFPVFFFLGNFFGFHDTGGIGKATISSLATDPFPITDTRIDNVEFGRTADVPEPSSVLLLLSGLASLSYRLRRGVPRKERKAVS
jgi:hypothetical protein